MPAKKSAKSKSVDASSESTGSTEAPVAAEATTAKKTAEAAPAKKTAEKAAEAPPAKKAKTAKKATAKEPEPQPELVDETAAGEGVEAAADDEEPTWPPKFVAKKTPKGTRDGAFATHSKGAGRGPAPTRSYNRHR